MRATWIIAWSLTVLTLSTRPALGQRLSNAFVSARPPEFVVRDRSFSLILSLSDRPRECAPGARVFLIAAGALGGAAGGYIGYEILWGIWPGSPPGVWGRPFRTTLIVGGGVFGAIGSARQLSRVCNPV